MPIVCLQCDRAGDVAGKACARCGAALVAVVDDGDLVGTVIDGRFEITGLLGRGGMGAVYRATQRSIGRAVALKLMDRGNTDAAAAKRFFREAKLASQLAHPNTVSVIEFGQHTDGRLYLVMELVAGRTLHDVLECDGAFPHARLVRVGTQLCDALEAAHALGIVHRDLKPDNVILDDRERLKVLDFGLARAIDDPTMRATATGVFAGTPRYMAPEITTGAEPATSQDIYALGVILAELATNRALFSAPTIESIFALKMSPTDELAGLAPELAALVARMMSPAVAERPTAAEVRDALARPVAVLPPAIGLEPTQTANRVIAPPSAVFAPPVTAEPTYELEAEWQREKANPTGHINVGQPKRSSAGPAIAAVALLVVAGLGAGGWWWWSHRAKPEVTALPASVHTVDIRVTAHPDTEITVDGKRAGSTPFTLHELRGTRSIELRAPSGAFALVIPDRDQVVDLSKR